MAKPSTKQASAKVSKTNVAAPAAPTAPAAQGPAQDGGQLTIADLQALASVIDVAVRRGAFGASEVTEVGAVFDKLNKFLTIIAQQKAAEEARVAEDAAKAGV
jgi:hypothetical protein